MKPGTAVPWPGTALPCGTAPACGNARPGWQLYGRRAEAPFAPGLRWTSAPCLPAPGGPGGRHRVSNLAAQPKKQESGPVLSRPRTRISEKYQVRDRLRREKNDARRLVISGRGATHEDAFGLRFAPAHPLARRSVSTGRVSVGGRVGAVAEVATITRCWDTFRRPQRQRIHPLGAI